jgi:dienelactone hydrolase
MFSDIKGHDTLIIVLHEIYGINRHIEEVCKHFSQCGYDVECPDIIDRSFEYSEQEIAYRYFIDNIGFEAGFKEVNKLVLEYKSSYKNIFIVGFSIGATIAWLCSGVNDFCSGIICVYGSRIRDYTHVIPKCPILLIFPTCESSFDVGSLTGILKDKNVETHILKGEHGFANPYSAVYNEQSSIKLYTLMEEFIQKF